VTPLVVVAALLLGAVAVTRVSGFAMRRIVRRIAKRSDAAGRWWRSAALRSGTESAAATEQRRRQRVDAAARMLNHVVSIVVWIGVAIAAFHTLEIDAAFFLSSAGFLGAGVAIGGQHKVNDYLTGLSVLFEDRYGVGDELLIEVAGEPVHAVVDNIGLVTTRLRDETSTLHIPNAQLAAVRNLSQEASLTTVTVRVPDVDEHGDVDVERSAAEALQGLAGTAQLTEVVFVGDLATTPARDGKVDVAVRTVRPLGRRARSVLVERAEEALGVPR
jgi:small-conductance mechanosensitive channel